MDTPTTIIIVFSILGILDTLYLIYHKIKGTDVACLFFPKEWCKKVQYSKYSKTFGIPNSVAGFFIYTAILILTLLFVQGTIVTFLPITILITIGFLFSLYFMYIQGAVLKVYCTWCVISFINFTIMLIALFLR